MPDKDNVSFGFSNCFIGTDGEWEPVGEVSEFDVSVSDDGPVYSPSDILKMMEPVTVSVDIKVPWYCDVYDRFNRLIGFGGYYRQHRCPYTVRALRRGGKSHRGKHA